MWKSVAEKIVFCVQWQDRKASTGLQFQQSKFSLEISKIVNSKDISMLL